MDIKAHLKCGRLIDSKDENPRKKKGANNVVVLLEVEDQKMSTN